MHLINSIMIRHIDNGWILRIDYTISHTEQYCKTFKEVSKIISNIESSLEDEGDGE